MVSCSVGVTISVEMDGIADVLFKSSVVGGVASSFWVSITNAGNTIRVRCLFVYVLLSRERYCICTTTESNTIVTGVWIGRNSHNKIRDSSFAVLLVVLLVLYATGRGWTRKSSSIVERFVHVIDRYELLMAVMVTLTVTWAIVGCWLLRLIWWLIL